MVSAVVRRLPRRLVLTLGRQLGRLWAALDPRHLAIAADNLRRAFPEWDEARVQATARGVYAHFATVLLDIAPEVAAARKSQGRDKFERDLPMLGRVRASYRRQAEDLLWIVIDAARPAEAVAADVASAIERRLGPR